MSEQTQASLLAATLAARSAELEMAERNAVEFPELAHVWRGSARSVGSVVNLLESADEEQRFTLPVVLKIQCPRHHVLALVHAAQPHHVFVPALTRSHQMWPSMFGAEGRRQTVPESAARLAVFEDMLTTLTALSDHATNSEFVFWCSCRWSRCAFTIVREAALDPFRAVLDVPSGTVA